MKTVTITPQPSDSPLESKKFVMYLLAQLCWTGLIIFAIGKAVDSFWLPVLQTMVVTQGFLQVFAIGGQAWIDRYLYVAQVTHGRGSEE